MVQDLQETVGTTVETEDGVISIMVNTGADVVLVTVAHAVIDGQDVSAMYMSLCTIFISST